MTENSPEKWPDTFLAHLREDFPQFDWGLHALSGKPPWRREMLYGVAPPVEIHLSCPDWLVQTKNERWKVEITCWGEVAFSAQVRSRDICAALRNAAAHIERLVNHLLKVREVFAKASTEEFKVAPPMMGDTGYYLPYLDEVGRK